jgi:hypothetical protein
VTRQRVPAGLSFRTMADLLAYADEAALEDTESEWSAPISHEGHNRQKSQPEGSKPRPLTMREDKPALACDTPIACNLSALGGAERERRRSLATKIHSAITGAP